MPSSAAGAAATNGAGPKSSAAAGSAAAGSAATGSAATTQAPLDEAQAAVSATANFLRDVRERSRAAHQQQLQRWQNSASRHPTGNGTRDGGRNRKGGGANGARGGTSGARDEAMAAGSAGTQQAELARLELAIKALENAWLFLEPHDDTLVGDPTDPASRVDVQMRIVEAQEAERNRLAREVHDGPAQALANGIFQVEIIERLLDRDERLARQELQNLRDMLTRELRGVRAYLSQLRPPLLADLGLAGAIREAAEQIGSVIGVPVEVEVDPEIDRLPEPVEVVILRVVQEALQNVRKHAQPRSVRVRAGRDGANWQVEIRDDGIGFDLDGRPNAGSAPNGGRRSFGLQFMRERAELIGGRFEVRSGKDLGTVVRLVVPGQEEETR